MSQKQRLQQLLEKFKEWSEEAGDETLDEHIASLETEIQLLSETDSEDDGSGGNHPLQPSGKP